MADSKINTATPRPKLKIPRTFEIMVEEMNELDDGRVVWRPVTADPKLGGNGQITLTVTSKEELLERQKLYEMAGQRFKILRELNPPSKEDIERMAAEQGVSLARPKAESIDAPRKDEPTPSPAPAAQPARTAPAAPKQPPKIITIGDVQIKYDGDAVYQRQWVRLSPKEETNVRVVSDSNNKIVPMKNRHFEVRRWVKVEGGSVLDEDQQI